MTPVSSLQSRAMRVKLTLMVNQEDARTSAFSAGATSPGAAAVVPDSAWEVMGCPAKVSPPQFTAFLLCTVAVHLCCSKINNNDNDCNNSGCQFNI